MNIKKKPDIDKIAIGTNPFMVNSMIKVRTFTKSKNLNMQSPDKILTANLDEKIVVEYKTNTKIFHDTDYRNILLRINGNALKLFLFISYQIETNEDYIWLNSSLFSKSTGLSKKDMMKAVNDLIKHGIITTTIYKDTYFINPLIMFSGDRLKKYPNNLTE